MSSWVVHDDPVGMFMALVAFGIICLVGLGIKKLIQNYKLYGFSGRCKR